MSGSADAGGVGLSFHSEPDRKCAEFQSNDGTMDYSKITKIWSHQVATAQCRQFLAKAAPQAELEQAGDLGRG